MNKLILIVSILFTGIVSKSQIKAVTENGREVLLFDNGNWKYSDSTSGTPDTAPLKTNAHIFVKNAKASFCVKSNTFNVGVFIDPSKWVFSLHKDNEKNPEYRFNTKSGDGYAMIITENTPIELETMRRIALINAQKAAVDVKETAAEYRMVNNKKVLCLKMEGTIQSIKFVYLGYYYSNKNGTVQLLCYTSQKEFDGLESEFETFLNGLVDIEK